MLVFKGIYVAEAFCPLYYFLRCLPGIILGVQNFPEWVFHPWRYSSTGWMRKGRCFPHWMQSGILDLKGFSCWIEANELKGCLTISCTWCFCVYIQYTYTNTVYTYLPQSIWCHGSYFLIKIKHIFSTT